MLPAGSLKNKQ